jgi:gamma-glutamylcyclotransferase (GGCT)/AIG2-like uncharacterized protein YtfP
MLEDVSFYNVYVKLEEIIKGDEYTIAEHCVDDLDYYHDVTYLYTVKLTHKRGGAVIEHIELDHIKEQMEQEAQDERQYDIDVRREYYGGVL